MQPHRHSQHGALTCPSQQTQLSQLSLSGWLWLELEAKKNKKPGVLGAVGEVQSRVSPDYEINISVSSKQTQSKLEQNNFTVSLWALNFFIISKLKLALQFVIRMFDVVRVNSTMLLAN